MGSLFVAMTMMMSSSVAAFSTARPPFASSTRRIGPADFNKLDLPITSLFASGIDFQATHQETVPLSTDDLALIQSFLLQADHQDGSATKTSPPEHQITSILLGTSDLERKMDGLWHCRQPKVDFIGLDLVPVLVNDLTVLRNNESIDIDAASIHVKVVDSYTELQSNGRSSRLVAKLMEKAIFGGSSRLEILSNQNGGDDGQQFALSLTVALTLSVPLPPLLPLPPGFNRIGSRIVQSTVTQRTAKTLQMLVECYQEHLEAGQLGKSAEENKSVEVEQ